MSSIKYGSLPLQACVGKTYYIGDIHNEADKLMSLIDQIEQDFTHEDRIVFLGDLLDRGILAALTVTTLVELNRKYPGQVFFIRGNHDWMLQNYLITGAVTWMQYLIVTLDDFKTAWKLPDISPNTIMEALIARGYDEVTIKMLPYYETEEVIATHAPLDKIEVWGHAGIRCEEYKEEFVSDGDKPDFEFLLDRLGDEVMWQFSPEDQVIEGVDKFRICGHQPGKGRATHPRVYKDRAFIDTGCGKGDRPCTALIYPGKKWIQSF